MSTEIELKVDEVTLLEDRAQVVRRGQVRVEAGTHELYVPDVAPVLVDKTLQGWCEGAAEITDVRVKRRRVLSVGSLPEEAAALEAEYRAIESELDRTTKEEVLLKSHVAQLSETVALALGELSEDASWGKVDPGGWESRFETLREAESVQRKELAEVRATRRRLTKALQDLESRIATVAGPETTYRADLLIRVAAEEATEVQLRVDYLVPGACWRPWHRATLREAGITFESDGCVWQRTGEDWTDAQLFLSTERASLGVEPPEVDDDLLRVRKIGSTVVAETREQEIHTAGLGGGGEQTTPELPGIDDGGEPRRLTVRSRSTVPSDGRPHRFPVFDFAGECTSERVLMAELTPVVMLRSEQGNTGTQPILPDPVDLVRDSGLVGRTWVDFVAAGERFELGWGPDLAMRVHREHDREDLEKGVLSSWSATRHEIAVRLSNIGPEDAKVQVTERIPVSELDKVKVDLKSTAPSSKPDPDGMLKWQSVVPAYGQDELKLVFEVRSHSDVVGLEI